MKKTIKTIAIIVFALSIFSCKKAETGPTGATGPQGNANVQTTTQTIQASSWSTVTASNQSSTSISIPTITQSIIDKGSVELFYSTDGTSWEKLPAYFDYIYTLGEVQIYDNISTSNSVPTYTVYFKIVVIAGQ
jgi:hypothetical protein